MGHPVTYLIDVRGAVFNGLLSPTDQLDPCYLDELARSPQLGSFDARLAGDDLNFIVDVTGEWTLCKLPYNYSGLLGDPANPIIARMLAEIEQWERNLRALIPTAVIYRIDDFLLDPWNARYDYLLTRDAEAVSRFIDWLKSQNPMHWCEISLAHRE